MLQKTKGIVLHTLKYNDVSMIVDIYTELFGRASFLVSIPKSRKSVIKPMLFQPLSLIDFETEVRPNSSLYRIKNVKSYYPYSSIPYHPYKSSIALFLAEFLYRALHEEFENHPLFAYLQYSIVWLDECQNNFANFHLVFLMRLSRFLGIYPNLENYQVGDYFDMVNACFVSNNTQIHTSFIAPQEARVLLQIMRMRYETMSLFPMSRDERNRCLSIIHDYYRLHLPEFPALKSLDVLRELFD